jgi:outer membrane lipoprotein-sorting protein
MAWGANTPKPQTLQYEIKLKSETFGNMGVRKMWIKGSNMRWEYMSAGLPLKLVKNNDGVFLIHPWNKVAARYPTGSDRGNPMVLFPGPTSSPKEFLKSVKAVKRGAEKINKELCNIYSYADPTTTRECRIWISAKSGKPVKLCLSGKHGKADPITATYTKFVISPVVSDKLFELPKGYAIKPMPSAKLTTKNIPKQKDRKNSI